MRVVVVGGSGTIGRAVVEALGKEGDEVIAVSRSSTPSVDITDPASVQALFETIGSVDAVVSAAGHVPAVELTDATPEDFAAGFAGKLGGQINLVLGALPHLRDRGSLTLTTGILRHHRIPGSVITGAVNGGLESFVDKAAFGLPRGIRINAVSPTIVLNPGEQSRAFRGWPSVTPEQAAQGYVRSVYGVESGQIFRIWG